MRRNVCFRAGRKLICVLLIVVLAVTLLLPASAISQWFFQTHTDWHFDLTKEPNRPMTVEEYIALTTAYSYWSVGTAEGDTPRDRDGNLPSDWAAPYIRCETQKNALRPSEIDYDAPVTLAFAMQFTVNSKGLQGYSAVNFYDFKGTQNLTTEQRLCLNAAIDYWLFPYTPNMDVSVPLLRRDLENKYLIPSGELKQPRAAQRSAESYPNSMAFFEDCYWEEDAAADQLAAVKENSENFNIISLDTIYLTEEKLAQKRTETNNTYSRSYAAEFIHHDNYGDDDPQLELIDFCHENGIAVYGGVLTWYNASIIRRLSESDAALQQAVNELVEIAEEYHLDGLNIDIELDGNTYRDTYSAFVRALSPALHANGKKLMLTVGGYMRLTDEQKTIYDYRAIDEAADLITIVTYDLHSARSYNSGGQIGEISNLTYTGRCLRYAAACFGPERLLLGVANYGIQFNTTDHTAKNLTAAEVEALQRQHQATVQTSGTVADDAYFSYSENGKEYVVYFESDAGMERRVSYVLQYALGGVACFHIGSKHQKQFAQVGSNLTALPFRDVSPKIWYYDGIRFAYEKALFDGVTPTQFKPDSSMTRAMLVTVLWRYEGKPSATNSKPFADVASGLWYSDAIAWASSEGIVNGVGQGRFAPDSRVTRQQIATILYRYALGKDVEMSERAELLRFTDAAEVGAWAKEAMQWAVAAELIKGMTTTGQTGVRLNPNGDATRAQTATILMRFILNTLE